MTGQSDKPVSLMPWLTQDEIDDLCTPLKQHAAQIRFMRDELGLTVRTKPNGAPLVVRSHFEQVMNPAAKASNDLRPEPNWAALRSRKKAP